ncbi:MAG: cobalt-precorrin-5B (C(1))-methyltransferase CbiD, partial [Planctomycetota bacterium]|nr:cobalt-precorrin-5B (C(1))-methyltransferase CbiD [Planctomycetota bacterium]
MNGHPAPKGCGPTTGACAAAAALAAAKVWLGESQPERVEIVLPGGRILDVVIDSAVRREDGAEATVIKPDNDDDDATRGLAIRVRISRREGGGIVFAAGEGVGTVTRPGLSLPPGEPAVNPTPRAMIADALSGLDGGWRVEISVPRGMETAEKTYNPRLGIVGGISIIGRSGLVRPYCGAARRSAFLCSFRVARESGHGMMVMVPGNIGRRAVEKRFRFAPEQLLETGNAWDDA